MHDFKLKRKLKGNVLKGGVGGGGGGGGWRWAGSYKQFYSQGREREAIIMELSVLSKGNDRWQRQGLA